MKRYLADKDLLSSLLFVAFGIAFLVPSFDYGYGSPARMGAGYFPRMLSLLLIVMGLFMLVTAVRKLSDAVGEHAEPVSLRLGPMSLVAGAVLAFAVLLPVAGVIAATLSLVVLSGAAAPDRRWHEIILFAIGITVFVVLVFVNALSLPLPLFPMDE